MGFGVLGLRALGVVCGVYAVCVRFRSSFVNRLFRANMSLTFGGSCGLQRMRGP